MLLLTGANMGGKTTLMRGVAVCTVMAQMGCYVPAKVCQMNLVDQIHARIGAADNIAQGQSTFYVEAMETATCLRYATRHSLVCLDELGRGTSSHDGYAIAYAVLDSLTTLGCRGIFATHYHGLCKEPSLHQGGGGLRRRRRSENHQSSSSTRVQVAHMKVQRGGGTSASFRPLFTLGSGPAPFGSCGADVARAAGVPADIVDRAREMTVWLEEANEVLRDQRRRRQRQRQRGEGELVDSRTTKIKKPKRQDDDDDHDGGSSSDGEALRVRIQQLQRACRQVVAVNHVIPWEMLESSNGKYVTELTTDDLHLVQAGLDGLWEVWDSIQLDKRDKNIIYK